MALTPNEGALLSENAHSTTTSHDGDSAGYKVIITV